MKSERPDLPLTIARLVRSATPVTPLDAPSIRLARWAITAVALAVLSVVVLGVRADIAAQMESAWFIARAIATLGIVVSAAIVAFRLSVPGVELSLRVRALPFSACLFWAAMLVASIAAARSPLTLLGRVTPHPSCVLFIASIAMVPAVIIVRMLWHAAPLQTLWTGAFAGLASLALGALGAQFVCSNDAAGHQLLWHFTPVVLLTLASVSLGWLLARPLRRPS